MADMRYGAAILLSLCLTAGAAAQEAEPDGNALRDGLGLFAEGSRLILGGLLEEMGPVLRALEALVDDIAVYELPERLPNGDILIRRAPDAPPPPPDGTLEPDIGLDL